MPVGGEWIALGVLTLPCLLYAMDLTVLNLAVPVISKSLRPSSMQLLWIHRQRTLPDPLLGPEVGGSPALTGALAIPVTRC